MDKFVERSKKVVKDRLVVWREDPHRDVRTLELIFEPTQARLAEHNIYKLAREAADAVNSDQGKEVVRPDRDRDNRDRYRLILSLDYFSVKPMLSDAAFVLLFPIVALGLSALVDLVSPAK